MSITRYSTGRLIVVLLLLLTVINVAALAFVLRGGLSRVYGMEMIRTKEPLLIAGRGDDEHYYVLPVSTTLYYDKSYPEGFSRYMVFFNHKGVIAGDPVPMKPEYGGSLIDPRWLSSVDADALKDIFQRFPLSKKDIAAAIKANEITKEDLTDIIRSMPD